MSPEPAFVVDTHCHLDAADFDGDRDVVKAEAAAAGVRAIVIPAVAVSNFATVATLAATTAGGCYALGIHPMATPDAATDDIATLRAAVAVAIDDPRFVAIGEIGLDRFVPSLATPDAFARQVWFLDAQLKIARDFDLPVLLHVRRAQDEVLAALRRVRRDRPQGGATVGASAGASGIAHAFNGSRQQADAYLALGFRLGFGGAATFPRALRIRALAATLPDDAIVLETDAPDIAPEWVPEDDAGHRRNSPAELPRIAASIAALRDMDAASFIARTTRNARATLPRLDALLTALDGAGRIDEAATRTTMRGTAVVALPSALPSASAMAMETATATASATTPATTTTTLATKTSTATAAASIVDGSAGVPSIDVAPR